MRPFLITLLALALLPLRAEDSEAGWSPVMRGLQARFYITPEKRVADWKYNVVIEFRNMLEISAGIGTDLTVRYSPRFFTFTVTNAAGQTIAAQPDGFGGMERMFTDLALPPWARLTFPMGKGGGTPSKFATSQGAGRTLVFDTMHTFFIPSAGGPYTLSATFDIPDKDLDPNHPFVRDLQTRGAIDRSQRSYRG